METIQLTSGVGNSFLQGATWKTLVVLKGQTNTKSNIIQVSIDFLLNYILWHCNRLSKEWECSATIKIWNRFHLKPRNKSQSWPVCAADEAPDRLRYPQSSSLQCNNFMGYDITCLDSCISGCTEYSKKSWLCCLASKASDSLAWVAQVVQHSHLCTTN